MLPVVCTPIRMTTYHLEYAVPGFCLSNSLNYANKFLIRPGQLRFKSEQFTVAFYNKKNVSIHLSSTVIVVRWPWRPNVFLEVGLRILFGIGVFLAFESSAKVYLASVLGVAIVPSFKWDTLHLVS